MRKGGQWLLLGLLTAGLVAGLKAASMPAALLLGPLLAGIAFGLGGATVRPAKSVLLGAYTIVGCMVAVALGQAMGPAMLAWMPVFLLMAVSTLLISAGLGWGLARLGWFPGSTAIWGLAPGGAAGMVAMAQEQGGDGRLVAVMQYLRILMVTGAAIGLAHAMTGPSGTLPVADWFPPLEGRPLAETLLLAGLGGFVAYRLRFSAASFLLPGLAGAALIAMGLARPSVPPLLAAAAYALIGWNIGLGFTRSTLRDCVQAFPRILSAAFALIGLCAGMGLLVGIFCDVDPLTAYLATTPGGIDAILIIATTVPVDLPFILSAQVVRVLVVLLAGPPLAAFVARQRG